MTLEVETVWHATMHLIRCRKSPCSPWQSGHALNAEAAPLHNTSTLLRASMVDKAQALSLGELEVRKRADKLLMDVGRDAGQIISGHAKIGIVAWEAAPLRRPKPQVNAPLINLVKVFNRYLLPLFAACLLQLVGVAALAQDIVTLDNETSSIDISGAGKAWVDVSGKLGAPLPGTPQNALLTSAKAGVIYNLGGQGALWQHYRFATTADSRQEWLLSFPHPLLDRLTVYQRTPTGDWLPLHAGDTLAVASWPEPGRYARFPLQLRQPGEHDVFVRIQHRSSTSVPVLVETRRNYNQSQPLEYGLTGLMCGALLVLMVACLVQSRIYRDEAYAWYAVYALLVVLTIAAWTGVAGHVFWPRYGTWNDLAPGIIGTLGTGAILMLVRHLCGFGLKQQWFDRGLLAMGMAAIPLALAYPVLPRNLAVLLVGTYLITGVITGLGKAWTSWRLNDTIGMLTFFAFTPTALVILLMAAYVVGLMPVNWISGYGLMNALIVEIPILMVALNLRTREEHTLETRAKSLVNHDALTGLLAPHIFQEKLKQILERSRRRKEAAAVMYVELVNHRQIKMTSGNAEADKSILRSVIKLRRHLRGVRVIGRIDDGRFGLVLEGVSARASIIKLATRLRIAGMIPHRGLTPRTFLHFHFAAVMLKDTQLDAFLISEALEDLLSGMAPSSDSPIVFLEAENEIPFSPEEPEVKNGETAAKAATP